MDRFQRLLAGILLLLAVSCAFLYAKPAGLGYVNNSIELRLCWSESAESALALSVSYMNDFNRYMGGVDKIKTNCNVTLAPLYYYFVNEKQYRIGAGLKFTAFLNYEYIPNSSSFPFWLSEIDSVLALPDVQINIPVAGGLYITGSLGLKMIWYFNRSSIFSMSALELFGPSLGSLGFIYYFGSGDQEGQK
jgi:hypothetical protein